MPIHFKDFAPKQIAPAKFLKPAEFDSLDNALSDANDWIEASGIEVVNVETIVLPNMHAPHEEGSADAQLHQSGDFATAWNQFIRVWFRD